MTRILASFALALAACTVFDHRLTPKAACTANSACNDQLGEPAWCVHPGTADAACVALLSDDCKTITGDPTDDNAVLISTLLSITGAQATTNLARPPSAILAVEEI